MIALGTMSLVVTNFTTSFAMLAFEYTSANPVNVVYFVASALFYWAAFEQEYLPADTLPESESAAAEDRARQWETLFPAIAVALVLLGALAFRDVLDASVLPFISVGAVIFIISLAFRSWWGQRVETTLRNEALASQERLEAVNRELREEMETRAQVEAQLRQVQKMDAVGQLTGGIAHDFNNLLAVIMGNLDMLQEHVATGSEQGDLLNSATEAAERGASLTQRLLALSRKQSLNPVAVDTDELLAEVKGLLQRTLGEKYSLDVARNSTIWACKADRAQLENTLLNLALNARDAMPQGGQLKLQASNLELLQADLTAQPDVPAGPYVAISVADTGEGISPENLPKVFEPFFTTKDVGKGTGLGLSMVYGFAKQSGGHVKIESEPGVGTVVTLYLPRSQREAEPKPTPVQGIVPRGNGESILIVEDEFAVREMVTLMLENLGYRVSSAEDGAQALSMFETLEPLDLMLSDVILPGGISGRELVRRLALQRPEVKALLMSGYAPQLLLEEGELEESDLIEGTLLLHKPFSPAQLANMVRDSLAL